MSWTMIAKRLPRVSVLFQAKPLWLATHLAFLGTGLSSFCVRILYFRVCRSFNFVCLHTIAHHLTLYGPEGTLRPWECPRTACPGITDEDSSAPPHAHILHLRPLRTSHKAPTDKRLSSPEEFEGPQRSQGCSDPFKSVLSKPVDLAQSLTCDIQIRFAFTADLSPAPTIDLLGHSSTFPNAHRSHSAPLF